MNRRSFLKLLGYSTAAAMLSSIPAWFVEKLGYIICLDADDVVPDFPVITRDLGELDASDPVWITSNAGESYISYDFWESKAPTTWEKIDSIPSCGMTLTWDDLW